VPPALQGHARVVALCDLRVESTVAHGGEQAGADSPSRRSPRVTELRPERLPSPKRQAPSGPPGGAPTRLSVPASQLRQTALAPIGQASRVRRMDTQTTR
jgi:hypothetical protein